MAISNDPSARRAAKGHIRGVPFVPAPRYNAEAQLAASTVNEDVVDADVSSEDHHIGMTGDDWINLHLKNMHAQVDRARKEATWSFAIALASIAINVSIIAHYFIH
jgi:hypothetical protein